jgi:hypothetical protein
LTDAAHKRWPWLLALVLAGALVRAGLLGGYVPLIAPDSSTYVTAASDLFSDQGWRGEGRRSPGYPLLIAAVGADDHRIVSVQMGLGLAISCLLFFITLSLGARAGVAFAVGLAHDLSLQQLFYEGAVLSETLATASVVATAAALLVAMHRIRENAPAWHWLLVAGACSAAAIMVRGQFLYLPIVLVAVVGAEVWRQRGSTASVLAHAAVVLGPAFIAVVVWAGIMQTKVGQFALSTQAGIGFANHSVQFIELAPPEYARLKDILLRYRERQVAETGHVNGTVWYAMPAIQAATGWSLPEASRQLQKMSMRMFAEHPGRYAVSVVGGWLEFWTVPLLWEPSHVRPGWLVAPLEAAWWVEHKLLRLSNAAFMLLLCAVALSRRFRSRVRWDPAMTAVSAVILGSSLLQAVAERSAGGRYGIPTQSLVVLIVVVAGARGFEGSIRKRIGSTVAARDTSVAFPQSAERG